MSDPPVDETGASKPGVPRLDETQSAETLQVKENLTSPVPTNISQSDYRLGLKNRCCIRDPIAVLDPSMRLKRVVFGMRLIGEIARIMLHAYWRTVSKFKTRNQAFSLSSHKMRTSRFRTLRVEAFEERRLLATYIVNTSADDNGTLCTAENCSLRSAINAANQDTSRDRIEFSIPGSGIHSIVPLTALPPLTQPVVIDATTQPGYVNSPRIVIDGNQIKHADNVFESGLLLRAGDSEIRGLSIVDFPDYGIWVDGPGNTKVVSNYVGVLPDGVTAIGNGRGDGRPENVRDGIGVINSPNNRIGGPGEERNVVSGNNGSGILLWGPGSVNNLIENNYVGADLLGNNAVPNSAGISLRNSANGNDINGNLVSGNLGVGVLIDGAGVSTNRVVGNQIGTTSDGMSPLANQAHGIWIGTGAAENEINDNLVSGNLRDGVLIVGAGTSKNRVARNRIGTKPDGMSPLPNQANGIWIGTGSTENEIDGNLVSGNLGNGVLIVGADASKNRVIGNQIGTTSDGMSPLANEAHGIWIGDGATENVIGAADSSSGNLISGNQRNGVIIIGDGTDRNLIQSNVIGLNRQGDELPNHLSGISIYRGPQENQIGSVSAGNVISGNLFDGIVAEGPTTSANRFIGNRIGTDETGSLVRSNLRNGMTFRDGTHSNSVGGTALGEGNTVAYNLLGSIRLDYREGETTPYSPAGSFNTIRGNAIFLNANQAIDIGIHGLNANDPLDADVGVNGGQNHPVIHSVVTSEASALISGTLNSVPNSSYGVDFYFSVSPAGIGDAQVYVGSLDVTTDDNGNASFAFAIDRTLPIGAMVVASATDSAGNTSELSRPGIVTSDDAKPLVVINDRGMIEGDVDGTLEFEVRLNQPATRDLNIPFTIEHQTTADADLLQASGSVQILEGSQIGSLAIGIRGDGIDEDDESFIVQLQDTTDIHLVDGEATGYLFDDDSSNQRPFGAESRDLASYMLGKVGVAVIVLDSDGTIDPEQERWAPAQAEAIKSGVRTGYDWWETALTKMTDKHELSFELDFTFLDQPVRSPYEPILRPMEDMETWISAFLDFASANSTGNFRDDYTSFFDARRIDKGYDWYFPLFVTLSANDSDRAYQGLTSPSNFGFAERWVLPHADYLASDQGRTVIHESAHVFYALDEYDLTNPDGSPLSHVYTDVSGYYGVQNTNAFHGNPDPTTRVPSVMSFGAEMEEAIRDYTSSTESFAMIGWRDSDGDGVFDVLDQPLELDLITVYERSSNVLSVSGTSSVTALENMNPANSAGNISINKVQKLEARINSGSWQILQSFNNPSAEISTSVVALPGDVVELRTVAQIEGVSSPIRSFVVPEVPSLSGFERYQPMGQITNADSVVFVAEFDREVVEVDLTDFAVAGGSTANVTQVAPVQGTGEVRYHITVAGGDLASFNGTVELDLAINQNITDADSNPLPNAEPAIDERYHLDNLAPRVSDFVVGGGNNSVVRRVELEFNEDIQLAPQSFSVTDQDGNPVTLEIQSAPSLQDVRSISLTFSGAQVDASGSLLNGVYTLIADAFKIHDRAGNALDGNADGISGDSAVHEFFRLFGDSDSDRDVDGQDYGRFGLSFLKSAGQPHFNSVFDFDDDGDVDGQDYGQFGLNFLRAI